VEEWTRIAAVRREAVKGNAEVVKRERK